MCKWIIFIFILAGLWFVGSGMLDYTTDTIQQFKSDMQSNMQPKSQRMSGRINGKY